MKTLAFAALVALSAAPAAFAASTSQILSGSDLAEIAQIVPGADLSNLTVAQAGALSSALTSDDRGANVGGQIRAILNAPLVEASRAAGGVDTGFMVNANSKGDRS